MNNLEPTNHLAHIRDQLAQLVARLEQGQADAPAAAAPLVLGRTLLRQVTVAEQAITNDRASAEALQHIDARYRDSIRRIDAMHDQLEHQPHPHRPDLHEHPPSSGSAIGDAVRDGFLNMG